MLKRWKERASRYPFYASSQRKVGGICDMPSADPYAPRRFLEAQVSSRHDQSALTSRLMLEPSLALARFPNMASMRDSTQRYWLFDRTLLISAQRRRGIFFPL